MPIYDFACKQCGASKEMNVSSLEDLICECGWVLERQFPTTVNTYVPGYMSARNEPNEAGRAKQRAWRDSDKCKKLRDEGKIDIDQS